MSVKSVMISCVNRHYTQGYIANVFWRQHIAQVSAITLIPYLKNGEICNIAYINIDQWCDSEAAYNLIQRLKDPSKEARIVHHDDDWWPVEINTHNNGDIYLGAYTLTFSSSYFVKEVEDDATAPCTEVDDEEFDSEVDDEEFDSKHPILVRGQRYTVEEAEAHLSLLKKGLPEFKNETANLEAELRIHQALQNSQNVTLREKAKPRWITIYPEADVNGVQLPESRKIACSNIW